MFHKIVCSSLKKDCLFLFYLLFLNYSIINAQTPAIQWQKFYGGTSIEAFSDAVLDENDNIIINSTTHSKDGDCINIPPYSPNFRNWLFKITPNGIKIQETFPIYN